MRIEITDFDLENDTANVDFEDECGTLVNLCFKRTDIPQLKKLLQDLEANFHDLQEIREKEA